MPARFLLPRLLVGVVVIALVLVVKWAGWL